MPTTTPKGWMHSGTHRKEYALAVDRVTLCEGAPSGHVASLAPEIDGFGTLMQMIMAGTRRGHRVRFSADVKCTLVADWAGLWMRIDGQKRGVPHFDNMQDRPIKGTADWTNYAVVLDVSETADVIAFGILLEGTGEVWISHVTLEVVGLDVPITAQPGAFPETALPSEPANLDFHED